MKNNKKQQAWSKIQAFLFGRIKKYSYICPMKLKDSYIAMRNSQQYSLNWFYNYFTSKGGKTNQQDFTTAFRFVNLEALLEKLDVEFEIATLHAPLTEQEMQAKKSVGKFIKIVI